MYLIISSIMSINTIPLSQSRFAEISKNALFPIQPNDLLQMHNSDGQGLDFFIDDSGQAPFGAGVITFKAGTGVDTHTHEGSHILMVLKGTGELGYYQETHQMFPGMIYNVPSNVPHSIIATTDMTLVVVGNDYRSVDSHERLEGGGSIRDKHS